MHTCSVVTMVMEHVAYFCDMCSVADGGCGHLSKSGHVTRVQCQTHSIATQLAVGARQEQLAG